MLIIEILTEGRIVCQSLPAVISKSSRWPQIKTWLLSIYPQFHNPQVQMKFHTKKPHQLRLSLQDMRPSQKRQTPKNSFTSKVSRYDRLFYDKCRIVTSQGYRWDGDQKEKGSFNEWAFRDGLAQEDRTTWKTHGCGLAWIDIIYGYGYHRPYWEF